MLDEIQDRAIQLQKDRLVGQQTKSNETIRMLQDLINDLTFEMDRIQIAADAVNVYDLKPCSSKVLYLQSNKVTRW